MRRKAAFSILALLLLILAGCSQRSGQPAAAEPVTVTIHSADVTELSFPTEHGTLCGLTVCGGRLLVAEMREGMPVIAAFDAAGTPLYETALEGAEEGENAIFGICAGAEDSFAVLFGADTGSLTSRSFSLARYDASGTLLDTVQLQELAQMQAVLGPVMTPEGDWLFWNPDELIALDENGLLRFRTQASGVELITAASYGGKCYAIVTRGAETGVCPIDLDTGSLGDFTALGSGAVCYTQTSSLEGGVLVNTGDALYGYDPSAESHSKLVDWQSATLDGAAIGWIAALGEDTYACLSDTDSAVFLITAAQQEAERRPVTVGVMRTGQSVSRLEKLVNTFNNNSSAYYAEIKYYDDPLQLKTELAAGTAPDVLEVSAAGLPLTDSYFEDLLPYIDSDPVLERGGLMESVLDSLMVEGKLTSILPDFYVETVVGRTADVGTESGWTMEDLLRLWEEKGEEYAAFPAWLTSPELLLWVCHISLGQFMDWENLTCDFTSDAFISLLELCQRMPDTLDMEKAYPGADYEENILLTIQQPQSAQVLETMIRNYGGAELTYIGFPNDSGSNGSFFKLPAGSILLAIPARTENKEAAWQLVRESLTDSWQQDVKSLPVLRSALEAQLYALLDEPDAVLSEADVQKFLDLIENTEIFVHEEDDTISSIIMEETEAFFEGDKSAAEVAGLIQNRASLYLAEQK